MDGLCVNPVLIESMEELEHSVRGPPLSVATSLLWLIKVEPLPPKSTMAVAAVVSSFGK